MSFPGEVWSGYRPHLVHHTTNFLVSGTIWLFLFLFHLLASLLPISGLAAKFLVALHSLGTIAAMAIFVWFSVNDSIVIYAERSKLATTRTDAVEKIS